MKVSKRCDILRPSYKVGGWGEKGYNFNDNVENNVLLDVSEDKEFAMKMTHFCNLS